uniref:Histocompatibility factor isoform 2 n=1 Tax=Botryllus schlosseri TaxID=30301 RepID=A0A0M4MGD3_BOTSH|nr:histocompatibility factor isoform 2 [Botryllus schlosseri]
MVHDTEQLLAQGHHEEETECGKYGKLPEKGSECKKHGIFCRILTALHLKKRRTEHDHQKLLSESQEHLDASTKKTKKKAKKDKRKNKPPKKDSETSKPAQTTISRLPSNRNNNNANSFATTYEKFDNDSLCSVDLIPVDIEFWDMENEPVDQLPHEILESVHMYGDDRFGERLIDRAQNKYAPLDEKQRSESHGAGEYLKHQWKGQGAKKARKVRSNGV